MKDIRNDSLSVASWRLSYQPSSCGLPLKIKWDRWAVPTGIFRLRDEAGGLLVDVDMREQDSVEITNPAITSLLVHGERQACCKIAVRAGWNMVSLPLLPADRTVGSAFPGSISAAYRFDNVSGYIADSALAAGFGYWVKFEAEDSVEICGASGTAHDIPVAAGWNLIGPFDGGIDTSAIGTTPPGIIESPFFGFTSSYQSVPRLDPGRAYWVRVTQAGLLHFGIARRSWR